jgi:N-acyl-D-aspartate/D-glutamate deacylase
MPIEHFDLLVRGGTLVDGTGAAARRGNLGIRNGRIAATGDVEGAADSVIDAAGCVVAPGFIDIHTHYDAQVFWDRLLSCSPWHGVTSVVMGNCGLGVAPTRPAHRDLILRTLENVEGMSLEALRAGLGNDWPFVSFPDFLDAIERRGTMINCGALVGHTPVRTYVMGEEAVSREATADEIEQMRRLVRESLDAGAIGFATSKAPTHVGYDGNPVPSRVAAFDEIKALASCLRGSEHGVLQATIGRGLLWDELTELCRVTERPVSWTALLGGMFGPEGHRAILEHHAKLQADGLRVIPQVSCRPLMVEFNFAAPFPLESMSLMKRVTAADIEGRKRIYAEPEFRAALRDKLDESIFGRNFRGMTISEHPSDASLCERKLNEIAEERGVHPVDAALDLSLETDLQARFRLAAANVDENIVGELLRHPASMLGLSDAGAHASQLCDAGAPTTLLGKWVRDKKILSLEEGVRQLTSQPADVFGITDRGKLEVGLAADVAVFDPRTVGCEPVRRVRDFPAGADRLVADATGIRAVIVNGVVVRRDGKDLIDSKDRLPGRVLRGGKAS